MLYLVTGGSGSGKSEYAEQKLCELCEAAGGGMKLYLATMIPYGEETRRKIARHRKLRAGKGFVTCECYTDVERFAEEELPKAADGRQSFVLLECMSNLTANEMFGTQESVADDTGGEAKREERTVESIAEKICCGIRCLMENCRDLVVVTNEVFSESSGDTPEMRRYKQLLGMVNCRLADQAAETLEVVYGIPVHVQEREGVKTMNEKERKKNNPGAGLRLIIGGAFQGKRSYAKEKYPGIAWINGENCLPGEIDTCRGIYHFERYIRRLMETDMTSVHGLAKRIIQNNPDLVIICDEIGYGLVPVDAFERNYREQTGRICTELAEAAVEVERVVCGIGTRIK